MSNVRRLRRPFTFERVLSLARKCETWAELTGHAMPRRRPRGTVANTDRTIVHGLCVRAWSALGREFPWSRDQRARLRASAAHKRARKDRGLDAAR